MLLNKRVALPLLLSFISLTVLSVAHGAPYDLAVQVAREQIGKPYTDIWPKLKGPNAFDCSGFTEHVYRVDL